MQKSHPIVNLSRTHAEMMQMQADFEEKRKLLPDPTDTYDYDILIDGIGVFHHNPTQSYHLGPVVCMKVTNKVNGLTYTPYVGIYRVGDEYQYVLQCTSSKLFHKGSKGLLEELHVNNQPVEPIQGLSQKQMHNLREQAIKFLTEHVEESAELGQCQHNVLMIKDAKMCEHTYICLDAISALSGPEIKDVLEFMENEYNSMIARVSEASETGAEVADPLDIAINKFAFRYPILAEGDRGAGKTFGVRRFGHLNNAEYVELGGHEDITDMEMLGYSMPHGGNVLWIDGRLSQACRLAAKGKKVVLVLDEILRIPPGKLKLLLTFLTPDNGEYVLCTGRILDSEDGVAVQEVLRVPVANLCILATTNVGMQYNVEDMDPALRERFIVVRKDTTRDLLKKILSQYAEQRGFAATTVEALLTFYDKMLRAKQENLANDAPSTRILSNAITLADDEDDVKNILKMSNLQWVGNDTYGKPIDEQLKMVNDAIDAAFE